MALRRWHLELSEIKKMCRGHKLSAKGSRLDCLHRLKAKLKQQPVYQELYSKFCGSSGGLLCACCPHGIVHAIKFLLRGESPRDHVDIIQAFKHQPTLIVCDIPNFVARHGNKRVKDMFWPFEGWFADPSQANIEKLGEGRLRTSIPEFTNLYKPASSAHSDHCYEIPEHPITQTRTHFCAYDRFHQENTSVNSEKLRRVDLVPELSKVNTEVVEELFSEINRSIHFLTQMAPIHHIFVIRLLCHLRNEKRNAERVKTVHKQLRSLPSDYSVITSEDGKVRISTKRMGMVGQVKLMDYDTLIGIYHQGGAHWTAVVFQNNVGDILYYDSFGEKEPVIERIQINWRRFMTERVKAGLEESCPDFTVRYSKTNHRQLDGSSCGVYALQFIEDTICGRPFLVTSPSASRNILAERLYLNSELADVYCVRCGHTSGNLVVCRNCKCKFHLKCTSQNKRKIELCFSCNNL